MIIIYVILLAFTVASISIVRSHQYLNEIAFLKSESAALRIMNKVTNKTVEEKDVLIGCLRAALADSQAEVKQLRQSTLVHHAAVTARENNWRLN